MTAFNGIIILIALVLTGVSLSPNIRTNAWWQATVTPPASIIGSGFLVVSPLLAIATG